MFGSGALRKTLGLEREEVTGGWRKLKSEELHALNSPPNTTQTLEIAHHYHPRGKRLPLDHVKDGNETETVKRA